MTTPHDTAEDENLARLLDALAPRLNTPKAELVAEIEARLSALLGVEVREAFRAVAAKQHHAAPSLNLDRAHKSALVLIAHVFEEALRRAGRDQINGT